LSFLIISQYTDETEEYCDMMTDTGTGEVTVVRQWLVKKSLWQQTCDATIKELR
jgi:hypothetical protein